jgi:HK97 family phage portal protein
MSLIKNLVKAFNFMAKGAPAHGYWPIFDEGVTATSQFRTKRDYLSASQLISWVSVCCSKIATRMAMTGWGIYDADGNETKNADLLKLFQRPNPFMTFYTLREIIDWHLLLAGNAYILKMKATAYDLTPRGKYSELWILNPAAVEPILSEQKYIDGYRVRYSNGGELIFKNTDIVHLKEPNPIDDRVGMGKIQANEMLYNTEYAAQYYNWQFFAKGGRPATALVVPGSLNPEQINELEARFEKYRGVKNSHKNITLTDGMDIKDIGLSQKDMAFIEQRKFSREEILGIFGVPPAVAGIFEYANYANSKEQTQMFLADTIAPRLVKLQEALTLGIVNDFEPGQGFYFDNVVKKDEELYMKLAKDAVQNSLMTPNQARETYLDQPKDEDEPAMDAYYLPINMIPIADSGATPAPVTPPGKGFAGTKKVTAAVRQAMYRASLNTRKKIGKTIKKEMVDFFGEQEARVLAALVAQKSLPIDRKLSADDIFNFNKEKEELLKSIRRGHTAVVMRAIEDANNILGTSVDSSTGNPQVTARIGLLARKVTRVNETTRDAISDAIKEGVDAGESISELKARIEEIFTQARGYRAEMIARTESSAAYDKGSILSYQDAEVEFVDVFGCGGTDDYPETNCNRDHIPIDEADGLDFHPQHVGCFLPEMS